MHWRHWFPSSWRKDDYGLAKRGRQQHIDIGVGAVQPPCRDAVYMWYVPEARCKRAHIPKGMVIECLDLCTSCRGHKRQPLDVAKAHVGTIVVDVKRHTLAANQLKVRVELGENAVVPKGGGYQNLVCPGKFLGIAKHWMAVVL